MKRTILALLASLGILTAVAVPSNAAVTGTPDSIYLKITNTGTGVDYYSQVTIWRTPVVNNNWGIGGIQVTNGSPESTPTYATSDFSKYSGDPYHQYCYFSVNGPIEQGHAVTCGYDFPYPGDIHPQPVGANTGLVRVTVQRGSITCYAWFATTTKSKSTNC